MEKIEFHTKIDGKAQAVFVILYALEGKPWEKYPEKGERTNLVIPTCAMVNRADGQIGFIGGRVDPEETLEEAVKREAKEEAGVNLDSQLEPIVAHDCGHITTHAFAAKLNYGDLKKVQRDSHLAEHFGSEITGLFLPHLIDYDNKVGKGGGISHIIKSSLAPSVREELIHFLLNKKIFSEKELKAICSNSGYSIKDLLS